MLGKRIINTATGAACTTDTVQILGDTSCVAYYKMSDATDETGSNDGTPTNVNFNVAGKFGNAGEFNGSSSSILTSSNFANLQTFSVSSWINFNTVSGTVSIATTNYKQGGASGDTGWMFRLRNGNALNLARVVGGVFTNVEVSWTPSANTWYHVLVTRTSTETKFYVNGVQQGATQSGGSGTISYSSDAKFTIGVYRYINTNYNVFNGSIDQIRIFDRAITANEVTTLYNEVYCQPTIVPTDHFEPVLYTGNNTTQSISTLDFQPDFTWIKSRSDAYGHILNDSVRGANRFLYSNTTEAEDVRTNSDFSSFNSDGFTLGTNYIATNGLNKTFVAWNWKAGQATVSGTGTNAQNITYSANPDAGFSIVKFSTNGSTSYTATHGLNQAPELVLSKVTSVASNWLVYSSSLGISQYMNLDTTAQALTYSNLWNGMSSTHIGGSNAAYGGTNTFVNYCFHSVDGMSKIGLYVGTGAAGNSIVTGFRPAFVMVKASNGNKNWVIVDNKRGYGNNLSANTSLSEYLTVNGQGQEIKFLSNGFEVNTYSSWTNGNNTNYIYMAFAEEVFNPNGVTRNATNPFGDASELALYKFEDNANDAEGSYNGTASNVTYATGYIDKAAVFNGSSSDISLPFNLQNTAFSISFWAKNTLDSNNYYIIANNSGSSQSGWHIGGANSGGTVYNFRINNGSSNYLLLDSATVDDTDWHHVVVTWDNTTNTNGAKIYINGSLSSQGTSTSTTNFSFTNSTTQLMREPNGSLRSDGNLDQVRIFNRALDAGEVTQLYNE